jgi:Ca2+-binding EF-hand superfamily protein
MTESESQPTNGEKESIMLKTKLALGVALALAGTVAIAHPWGVGYGPQLAGGAMGAETWQAQMHQRHEARVKAADTDGDGTISRAEAEKALPGLARNFDAVDADKDGKVTVAELDAARTAGVIGGPGYGRRGAMRGPGVDPEARQAQRHERHEAMVKSADTDKDGAISRAEVEKALPRLAWRFEAVDADKDGKLTVAELDAARPAGKRGGTGYGRHGMGRGYGGGPCFQQPAPPKE